MRTYRELFGAPEFTPLFLTSSVQVAATVVAGLALGLSRGDRWEELKDRPFR